MGGFNCCSNNEGPGTEINDNMMPFVDDPVVNKINNDRAEQFKKFYPGK